MRAGGTTARAPPMMERLNFTAREMLKTRVLGCATFQGTRRAPCRSVSFLFHKPWNIYDSRAPAPCRQPPSCPHPGLAAAGKVLGRGAGQSVHQHPALLCRPAGPGMAREETVPFLSRKERRDFQPFPFPNWAAKQKVGEGLGTFLLLAQERLGREHWKPFFAFQPLPVG